MLNYSFESQHSLSLICMFNESSTVTLTQFVKPATCTVDAESQRQYTAILLFTTLSETKKTMKKLILDSALILAELITFTAIMQFLI